MEILARTIGNAAGLWLAVTLIKGMDMCSHRPLIINAARGGIIDEQSNRYRPAADGSADKAIVLFHHGHEHSGRMIFVADDSLDRKSVV